MAKDLFEVPLKLYFRDAILEALSELKVKTPIETEAYLVQLLSEVSQAEVGTPLVQLWGKALTYRGSERGKRMRQLGDTSLVLSGFWSQTCKTKGISISYTTDLGSRAYREAAISLGEPLRPSLFELSQRFRTFVKVLELVHDRTALGDDSDYLVLKLN